MNAPQITDTAGPDRQRAIAEIQPEPSVATMLATFIERGITTENVAAFAQLVELKERVDARASEKEFAAAFVALQGDMPSIQAVKAVPNKDGSIRYRFAPYEEIMEKVAPLLTRHGFTVSFNSRFGEGRITVICTLMHKAGHSRANEFAVRIGGGPPGATETQADGAAKTYAKRGALSDALNIVVEHDDDARAQGATISADEAAQMRKRVSALVSARLIDEKKLLRLAGVDTYEEIMADKMDLLLEQIEKREAKLKEQPAERDFEWEGEKK